jgi:predicted nucleotidyltransferase
LRTVLRTEQNVRFALLFGSTARGTDTPASDVDIVVDLRDPSLERLVDLSERLTAVVGRPVDVIRLQDAEADPLFFADVVTEGRVLVDRDREWPRLRRREAGLRRRGREEEAQRARAALAGVDRLLTPKNG